MKKIKLLSIISFCILSWNVYGQISGTVFRDFNANGVKDNSSTFNEVGAGGVIVKAYNAAGTQVGSVTSATDGSYSFTGLTLPVRLEFIPVLTNDFDGSNGAQSSSSVQFYSAASTNANFALNYPADYVQNQNPYTFIPIFNNGNPLAGGTSSNKNWLVGFPYDNSGSSTQPDKQLKGTIIGAVWGVAYSKQAQQIFTSAMIKRHSGLGTLGSGGIYKIDPITFNPTTFYDLDLNGYRTRADATAPSYGVGSSFSLNGSGTIATYLGSIDPITGKPSGLGVVGNNGIGGRNLPADNLTPNNDPAAFDQVGKVGLGDLEISDDGKYLFVVNLYSKKLLRLQLNDANNPTSVINVISYDLPSNTCSNGEIRPWATKFYRGSLFVGAVCSGENGGSTNDLQAFVYELKNSTGAATFNTTPIINYSLNYVKGASNCCPAIGNSWQPWTNDAASGTDLNGLTTYPSPILSDIEFTERGDLVMAFLDRAGHQFGASNYKYLSGNSVYISYVIGGDILVAGKNNLIGNYVLENNGMFTSSDGNNYITASTYNNQAPGGKEFYNDEFGGGHQETCEGSLLALTGKNEIMLGVMDPLSVNSHGTKKLFNNNGALNTAYELVNVSISDFGKANVLGDLELLSNPAPIEIGNRVWMDTDKDGVQDADEMGLDNITVKLYNGTTLVATKITANGGQYYFGTADGVLPNTNYIIRIEGSSFPTGKFVTAKDRPTGGVQDLGDNDASLVGVNADITYTTGNAGENNHTLDFGFSSTLPVTCPPDSLKICAGQSAEYVAPDGYTNYIWYKINGPGDTVQVATGQTFTTSNVGNYIYKAIDGSGCPVNMCCPVTVADTTCCVINNLNLVIGNCDNKGTLTNANDDEYTFTLNPTGAGVGTTYTVNGLPNSPQIGTYGSPTTFGPYLISAGVLNISVSDDVASSCSKTASVSPPPSCSVCNVSSPVLAVNDNICPNRTGTINLVQDCGAGTFIQYSINNGSTWSSVKPLYSTTPRTILARCVNSIDTTCKSPNTTVTTAPKSCPPNLGEECTLTANATIDPCNNNGTDNISTDDYFTIQVSATVANGGSSNKYEVVIGADPLTGIGGNVLNSGGTNYGSPVTVGNTKIFKADGSSTYQLVVRDINNNNCFQLIDIQSVTPCSIAPPKSPCYPVPCVPIGLIKN